MIETSDQSCWLAEACKILSYSFSKKIVQESHVDQWYTLQKEHCCCKQQIPITIVSIEHCLFVSEDSLMSEDSLNSELKPSSKQHIVKLFAN